MDREYKEKLVETVGKSILLIDVESFAEMFREWRWWKNEESQGFGAIPFGNKEEDGEIGDYCSTHRTDLEYSLHVSPKEIVLDAIRKSMIMPDYDRIYFELIQRKDGLLVVAKNNAIIASRWLALLPMSELQEIQRLAKTVSRDQYDDQEVHASPI